jgi:phage N-6-adenine-methyltransferase
VSAVELMTDLQKAGIEIGTEGGQIWYRPRSAVTPETLARMRTHKAELLAMLGSEANEPIAHTNVHFSSKRDDWETPQDLFDELDAEFHFTLDVCATPRNAKCDRYFTPDDDGLAQRWEGVCWCNPPYGREIGRWMRKAFESAQQGATVVCLVPARTDTKWWHEYAKKGERRELKGRIKFVGAKHPAPFPSVVVVFRPTGDRNDKHAKQSAFVSPTPVSRAGESDISPPDDGRGGIDLVDGNSHRWENCIDAPDDCPECGTLRLWQTLAGNWRCLRCDPPTTARRLRKLAARLTGRTESPRTAAKADP